MTKPDIFDHPILPYQRELLRVLDVYELQLLGLEREIKAKKKAIKKVKHKLDAVDGCLKMVDQYFDNQAKKELENNETT